MGTILTVLIAGVIIGYAVYTLRNAFNEARAGGCSGCSSCPSAHKCNEKHQ